MASSGIAAVKTARLIADYASANLALTQRVEGAYTRRGWAHAGATLADASLQAGLRYHTVVLPRVQRLIRAHPEMTTISQLQATLAEVPPERLLQWRHQSKISVFLQLTERLASVNVDTCAEMRGWLRQERHRGQLCRIKGVGPKTADYLALLVGVDIVPVDRHVASFVAASGADVRGYHATQRVVGFAADLLGVSRSNLDGSIWRWATQPGQA